MKKIIIPFICLALALTYMTGCSSDKNSSSAKNDAAPQSATTAATLPPNINPDQESARVSTLKNFFKSRSITLNEKVLRFSFDDAQMKYAGFEISSDKDGLSDIAVGDTVENIEYKNTAVSREESQLTESALIIVLLGMVLIVVCILAVMTVRRFCRDKAQR